MMEELMIDVSQLADGVCTTCGHGTRGSKYNPLTCDYCGDVFPADEHQHAFGMKVDGLQRCKGWRYLGCSAEVYDSQWGAGMFNDWPLGHSKPYGA